MSGPGNRSTYVPPRPSPSDPLGQWRNYWHAQGQRWRSRPEIDARRQQFLTGRLAAAQMAGGPNEYPFAKTELKREDIEWLIAHPQATESRSPAALDLRGAFIRGEDLSRLPLNHMEGGLNKQAFADATAEQRELAAIRMEQCYCHVTLLKEAELSGAHLEGSTFTHAHFERANLTAARLDLTKLDRAHLRGARLVDAYLGGASLHEADFTDADLTGAHVDVAALRTAHLVRTVGIPDDLALLTQPHDLVRLQVNFRSLTTNEVISLLSALTELHTKCWLLAQNRISDLTNYTTHGSTRFEDEAPLEVIRLSYNSPLDIILRVVYAFGGAVAIPYGLVLLAFVAAQGAQMHLSHKHAEWAIKTATEMVERCNPDLTGPEKLEAIQAMIPTVERLAPLPIQPLPLPIPGTAGAAAVQKKLLH